VQTIRVETPSAKYDVVAGSGLVETLARRIERVAGKLPRAVFVLTSAPIWGLWGEVFQASFAEPPIVLFLPPGEENKTIKNVEGLLREMARAGGDRGSLLIGGGGADCFGGGLWRCGRVSGLDLHARNSLCAGSNHILAQVDSSVGGKTGVNLPEGKNLVGSFYHPLRSLPI